MVIRSIRSLASIMGAAGRAIRLTGPLRVGQAACCRGDGGPEQQVATDCHAG